MNVIVILLIVSSQWFSNHFLIVYCISAIHISNNAFDHQQCAATLCFVTFKLFELFNFTKHFHVEMLLDGFDLLHKHCSLKSASVYLLKFLASYASNNL